MCRVAVVAVSLLISQRVQHLQNYELSCSCICFLSQDEIVSTQFCGGLCLCVALFSVLMIWYGQSLFSLGQSLTWNTCGCRYEICTCVIFSCVFWCPSNRWTKLSLQRSSAVYFLMALAMWSAKWDVTPSFDPWAHHLVLLLFAAFLCSDCCCFS